MNLSETDMKKTFLVLTPIRGLPRADLARRREPVAAGEIIAIPPEAARVMGLLSNGSIEPSDLPETCELDWGQPGGEAGDMPGMNSGVLSYPFDRGALIAATREIGGIVIFPGEPLDELAGQLSNAELVRELAARVESGRLPRWEIPPSIAPVPAADPAVVDDASQSEANAADGAGPESAEADQPVDPNAAQAETTAPAKPRGKKERASA